MPNEKKVAIYSTPSCMYCKMAKDFFNQNAVKYEEYDVLTDLARRQEMVDKSGQMGVPVIQVGDEMVIGFDKPLLTQLLGL